MELFLQPLTYHSHHVLRYMIDVCMYMAHFKIKYPTLSKSELNESHFWNNCQSVLNEVTF